MKARLTILVVPLVVLACATTPPPAAPDKLNDFPTQARVEFVLRCMDERGGQDYDTMYACTCSVDKLAEKLSYDEYVRSEVFGFLRKTPGERGGMFRDSPGARELYVKLVAALDSADAGCFIGPRRASQKN